MQLVGGMRCEVDCGRGRGVDGGGEVEVVDKKQARSTVTYSSSRFTLTVHVAERLFKQSRNKHSYHPRKRMHALTLSWNITTQSIQA